MVNLSPYLLDSLAILADSIQKINEGKTAYYRVTAAQLRLLLCDTTRVHNQIVDISLSSRLYPDLCLFPPTPIKPGFDRFKEPIPRLAWLRETIHLSDGQIISLRELIRLVCDRDGGVHVDPPPGELPSDRVDWIQAIGQYILQEFSDPHNLTRNT